MCWEMYKTRAQLKDGRLKPKVKIAKRDIVVYKYCTRFLNSQFEVVPNKCKGYYHSECVYTLNKENPKIKLHVESFRATFIINKGYHSYRKNTIAEANAKFVIPKGSRYYVSRQEIVSDQIIFKGWLAR